MPVFDQRCDGNKLQLVLLFKPNEFGQSSHGSVLVQDLANDPARVESCKGGEVHCGLGMPRALENPARPRP